MPKRLANWLAEFFYGIFRGDCNGCSRPIDTTDVTEDLHGSGVSDEFKSHPEDTNYTE